jgi:hypothetical protein
MKPVPEAEGLDRPTGSSFTAAYRLIIVRELDALNAPGLVGEVLRREGLYGSHTCGWRRLWALGRLQALKPKNSGRPKKEHDPPEVRMPEAERKGSGLEAELRKAPLINDIQNHYRRCWASWRAAEAGGPIARRRRARGAEAWSPPARRSRWRTRRVPAPTAGRGAATSRARPPALAASERAVVLSTINGVGFPEKAPAEVYGTLLDEGTYVCRYRP